MLDGSNRGYPDGDEPARDEIRARHRRHAQHALGVAADQRMADTAPPVRAHHDQVAAAIAGLLDDHVAHARGGRVLEPCLAGDAFGDDPLVRLVEQALPLLAQVARDLFPGRSAGHLHHHRVDLGHVQQHDAGAAQLGQPDRFLKAALGGGAAVDGNENALVHDSSFGGCM